MKKLLAAVACLVVLGSATTATAVEVTGDAYVSVANEYVWRGWNLTGDADYVVQSGADFSANGFTLSWWGNYNPDTNLVDEVDYILDYTKDLSETVSVSVGYTIYETVIEGVAGKLGEAYVGLSLGTVLEPSVTVYYVTDAGGTGLAGDVYVSAGIGHSIEISEKVSASVGASLGYANYDAWDGLQDAALTIGADYAVSEQVAISASALFSTPMSDDAEDVGDLDDESAVSLTASLSF